MTEFDPRKPLSRPSTPVATSWFEFLLDDTLLEVHLEKDNPEPTATELIIQFLYQADQAAATAKEISEKSSKENQDKENGVLAGDEPQSGAENKKVKALRLLALKTAGYLKWNLDVLDESIPVAMVYYLLSELLKVAIATQPDSQHQVVLDMSALPDQSLFALQLYHRWCLRTVISESFPVKPSKVAPLQIPGLLDPNIITAHMKDTVMKIVRDNVKDSIELLEQCQNHTNPLMMPTLHSFGSVKENVEVVTHQWDQGIRVPSSELVCQVCYDLGRFFFFQEDYSKAHAAYQQSFKLLAEIKEPVFCSIDQEKLAGYMCACNGIVGSLPAEPAKQSIMEKVEKAKKEPTESLVALLQEDNQKCELSLAYRLALEDELRNKCENSIFCQICISNMIRQAMDGRVLPTNYTTQLLDHPGSSLQFLIEVAEETVKTSSYTQKNSLKHFLRYLCLTLPADLSFPDRLLSSSLHALFSQSECSELTRLSPGKITPPEIELLDAVPPAKEDEESVKIGQLERHLLVTYDPTVIRNIIQQLLTHKVAKQQIMFLTDKWRLPREIQRGVDSIGVVKMQLYAHILVAKSRICVQLELFEKAKELLQTGLTAIKDLSFRLNKLLRWEQLHIELLQEQSLNCGPGTIDREEMIKKARSCITLHQVDRDMPPNIEVASLSAAFLLNCEDYKHLCSHRGGPKYAEFCSLMSKLCMELPMIQNSRAPARELWEAVALIFTSSTQQKRTSSGTQNTIQRDGYMGILPPSALDKLISKIKNPVALSAMISLLTKLYTTLKDNITCEVASDYVTLWPTALGNASSLNVSAVGDSLTALIEHALTVNPQQPSWLRTQADLCFAHNQYSQALKYYLEIGVVCTDYFSLPITKSLYDDQVYKKMIKCCSYLQCHTQVAVLCQFLDEIDYATAFKALQEKNCTDATDTYYDCIWDATMLEYIINLHTKRGESDKRQTALKLIGQLELNGNNPPDILINAAVARKAKFLQTLAKLYM